MIRGQGLGKFGALSWNEQLLFSEAYFLHLTTGLILKVIPFRRIPGLFKSRKSAAGGQQPGHILQVKEAIERAGRVSPWRNRCLVSSLVAKRMLNKRNIPSVLSLGLLKNSEGRVVAHAWLNSGDCELVRKDGDYTELYTF